MGWVHGALAAVCLAIGGLHLARLAGRRRPVVLEGAYAVMALGMAGMYSPVGDPVPAAVWAVLFLLGAGWFGGLMVAARSVGVLEGEAAHLVVGSSAMLFMLGVDQLAGGSHAAHAAGAAGIVGVASAVALVFAAYFVLHVLRCADRLSAARQPAPAPVAAVRPAAGGSAAATVPCAAPVPALAHLVMTAAMAIMLVGLI